MQREVHPVLFRFRSTRPSPTLILFFLLAYLLASIGTHVHEGEQILALDRTGMHSQATLTNIESGDSDDSRVQLEYSWPVPPGVKTRHPQKSFSDFYRLPEALTQSLHTGQKIEILYATSRPGRAIPALATQCAFQGIGWRIFFSILVFVLLLLRLFPPHAMLLGAVRALFLRSR